MASDEKWGPKFHEYFECTYDRFLFKDLPVTFKDGDILFIMVSELWDGSLENLESDQNISNDVIINFEKIVKKMHNSGIIHGDLFPRNILYKYDKNNKISQLIPTDFGRSFTMMEYRNNLVDEDYIRDIIVHILDINDEYDILTLLNITIEDMIHYPMLFDIYLVEYIKLILKF